MRSLTIVEPIKLPSVDLARPESMLSLPPWLSERLVALSPWGEGIWENGKNTPTIPASLTLTGEMRGALERRCVDLEHACAPGPEEAIENQIAELVARYATGKTDGKSAAVRIEWYMDALSDLPAWAVKEAIRRWRRGQCGPHNYDFAPAEAILRSVAESIVASVRGQCVGLRRLLAAQPVEELDEETRATNRARLALAMDNLVSELRQKSARVAEDERNHAAQKRKAFYETMERAAAERRQAMEHPHGGRDDETEGDGAGRADNRHDASAGDVR